MALIDDVYALIAQPRRGFSTIFPNVVIEEAHQDALGITRHPVEVGAVITDHSLKLPARCEMFCGWSDSGVGTGYVIEVYEALLRLQATREPFDIYTGKRAYRNMLFASLVTQTDQKTEHALLVRASFEEVIITRTRSAGGGRASAPNSAMADPASTGAVTERGPINAIPVGPADYGGYAPGLAVGSATFENGVGSVFVEGVGEIPGGITGSATVTPGALPGNVGQFGRYAPGAFVGAQPFRI